MHAKGQKSQNYNKVFFWGGAVWMLWCWPHG